MHDPAPAARPGPRVTERLGNEIGPAQDGGSPAFVCSFEPRRIASSTNVRQRPNAIAALALAASVAGCATTGFDGRVYRGNGFAFQIPAPPREWERLEAAEDDHGPALAFRDAGNDGMILINGRCDGERDDVPLASLTQHLLLLFTERDIKKQEVVPFDGREAMHSVVDAKLDGVRMLYDVWVLKKDGCTFDLVFGAPHATFERGQPAFRRVVHGFRTVSSNEQ
jgi:hypothetical protein